MSTRSNTLYVFIDESGNMDFTEKWTKHFVLAAITTLYPLSSSSILQSLKYRYLEENFWGCDYQHFHASEDKQIIRDSVFESMASMWDISVNWLWAVKSKTHPSLRNREKFYTLLGWAIVSYLLKKWKDSDYEKIVIIFDKALTNKEQNAFYSEVKPKLKLIGKPYAIYFHHTVSDFNGQIADYLAWAKYVSLEKWEQRPLEAIKNIPQGEFDIFQNGTTGVFMIKKWPLLLSEEEPRGSYHKRGTFVDTVYPICHRKQINTTWKGGENREDGGGSLVFKKILWNHHIKKNSISGMKIKKYFIAKK